MIQTLAEFFKEGGPFMFVNVATSAVAIAIIVERIIVLAFRLNLNAGPFMEQVQKLVLSGNVDRAVKLCGAAPTASLAKVIRAGLTRATRGEQEVARALEEHSGLGQRQLDTLGRVDEMIADITRAVENHAAATRRVRDALEHLSSTAGEHEAAVDGLTGVAGRLGARAKALAENVGRFKV